MARKIRTGDYAAMFGRQQVTSCGWRIPIIEVERDLTTYGEEVKLAAAKSFVMEWGKPRPRARRALIR
jgi:urease alpha subunit